MKLIYSLKRITAISILSFGFLSLYSQGTDSREFIKAFHSADNYYYYDENYEKAATLYEPLYKSHPDNCNLAAKLGICYLNLDDKKPQALELLKKASTNYAKTVREYTQTGSKAPNDVMLYLAIAYHRNDSLDKALSLYTDIRKGLNPEETSQMEFIDMQIRNCRYAMEMKKKPLRLITELFTPWLADYPGACYPCLAKNDSVFVFTEKTNSKTQVYCSYKVDNVWQKPSNITKQLGGYDRFYSNSITGNGKMLIVFIDDGGDGNLYYSTRHDTTWTKIRSVGRNINTIYWEAHGYITPDGQSIYFSSNRPGGEGSLDIWSSKRTKDGSWERPVNLGNIVNTPYDEDTPYFDTENNALIFSSTGHISMGGSDVFRSINRNGIWTQPVGMPYSFNDVLENKDFILNNNAPGFVASRFDAKTDTRNIYSIVAIDPADELTEASGTIKLEDGLEVKPELALITVRNLKTGEIVQNIPIERDGSFKFSIKPGEYQVFVSHDKYTTDTINISLPLYFGGKYLAVNPLLKPEKVSAGGFLSIKNILFDFDSYKLNDEAAPNLELLKEIMTEYPQLAVEVAGYTDSKGTNEYNRKLADKRAQAAINFLTAGGIDASRFTKKAFGKSNFAAVNYNPDGSDNPEGRKYNRRVTFGILDPQTGVVIRHEAYTPEHLRQPSSIKYSVILMNTKEKLQSGYFSNLIKDESLFIRIIQTDSAYIYALGTFFNKADAIKYMGVAKEKGLKDAYIISQYDLDSQSPSLNEENGTVNFFQTRKVFTIQLKATKTPINISKIFPGYKGVREFVADDGFYKYFYGEYESIEQAKQAIVAVKKDYDDAFIRELNLPVQK
jgi:outer membrane protein OmpA-like peptidoglycan-associated protein